jgi:hypothetical protein
MTDCPLIGRISTKGEIAMKKLDTSSAASHRLNQNFTQSLEVSLASKGISLRRYGWVCLAFAVTLLAGLCVPGAFATVYLTGTKDAQNSLFGALDVETRTYQVVNEYAPFYSAVAANGSQLYAASGQYLLLLDNHGDPSVYGMVGAVITGATFDSHGTFYATDKVESRFGTISPPPTEFHTIGTINPSPSFNFYGSLAIHDGAFYQTRDQTQSGTATLMEIDPLTGVGTQLGPTNDLFSQMILFDYENRLLGISSNPATFAHLYEINTSNISVTDLGVITGAIMPQSPLGGFTGAVDVAAVPEPSTFLLLGAGVGSLLFWRRRS